MKSESPPIRASSRIKARAKVAAATSKNDVGGNSSTTATSKDASPSDNKPASHSTREKPQAPTIATAVIHGFKAPSTTPADPTAAAASGQSTTATTTRGLPVKVACAAAAPNNIVPMGPPPPYAAHVAARTAIAAPPPPYPGKSTPTIRMDAKILEERKRNALAYAMQDRIIVGNGAGSNTTLGHVGIRRAGVVAPKNNTGVVAGSTIINRRAVGPNNSASNAIGKTAMINPGKLNFANATNSKNESATKTVAARIISGKGKSSSNTSATTIPKKTSIPAPNYPPASKLVSGVHALAEAAASSAKAVVGSTAPATTAKRKVGRPRKTGATTAMNAAGNKASKRKVGRPRKNASHQQSGVVVVAGAAVAAISAKPSGKTAKTAGNNNADFAALRSRKELVPIGIAAPAATAKKIQVARQANTQAAHTTNNANHVASSQTIPISNASSSENGASNPGSQNNSNTSSSTSTSNSNLNPLPLRSHDASSVYDDEYARFMRSIIGGDDGSIKTFKTWKSVKSQGGEGSSLVGESVMGSAFETLDEDDVSYQLTSDEDDDEDDDELDENEMREDADGVASMQASPQKGSASSSSSTSLQFPPTPLILPHSEETNDEDLMNVFGEIEGLMEEDLEAAVMASLIGGPSTGDGELSGSSWQKQPGTFGSSKSSAPITLNKASMGAIMGTQQQKAITTPGISTKKKKSTTTVVTTPSPSMKDAANRAATLASRPGGGVATEVPAVTKDQLARLRGIMARHHQLLLQQATLSVRAAYVQKVRKDGIQASHASPTRQPPAPLPGRGRGKKMDSSLPESRLDTRSLTFCSRPADSGCSYVNDFFGGETPEELSECLDGAVGMLQDLEQNWKDAVRNSIQLSFKPPMGSQAHQSSHAQGGRRNLNFGEMAQLPSNNMGLAESGGNAAQNNNTADSNRRLTRSAFTKTLLERELEISPPSSKNSGSNKSSSHDTSSSPIKAQHQPQQQNGRISVFDVRGLARLKETFSALDNSVKDIQMGREKGKNKDGINILAPDSHGKACETLLEHARAEIYTDYLPGRPDLGRCLTHAPEAFEEPEKVNRPLTKKQEAELRKNRHTFSAGEDNLILRGVNLYGEKEWCLVSDRFLPDRVVNSISQRYNKLCFLIYKANGIVIDEKGKLGAIPTFAKGATYDISKVNTIRPARAPTTMNVHRWTLEEDIAILKAVPVMGNLWAEICTKFMPHRDRGHIRKRYQVLQRRIPKGITKMNMKYLKRPPEQRMRPPKSPKRARASLASSRGSPAKKRAIRTSKKKAVAKTNKVPTTATVGKLPSKAITARNIPALTTAARKFTTTVTSSVPISATTAAAPAAAAARNLPATAAAAAPPSSPSIFQHMITAKRPLMSLIQRDIKMSPIKSPPKPIIKRAAQPQQLFSPKQLATPPKEVIWPSLRNHGSQAMEAVIKSEVAKSKAEWEQKGQPSPETRSLAALLGGFSASSRLDFQPIREHEEDTQMGVEKILGNADDWSQASGMQRLIEAGTAESNFMCEQPFSRSHQSQSHGEGVPPHSPSKSSELPMYQVHDGEASGLSVINGEHRHAGETRSQPYQGGEQRKSILSSVMEKTKQNALKRKSASAFPSTPTEKTPPSQGNVPPADYPSSIPTSGMTFSLDTPINGEGMGLGSVGPSGELSMNPEFFEYFMSDNKSRQVTSPGRTGTSHAKTSISTPERVSAMPTSPAKMSTSPAKYCDNTPFSQFGTLLGGGVSGPHDGCNSLLMGASDFDAVAALKDLSNSAPSTPSKLLRPRDSFHFHSSQEPLAYNQDGANKQDQKREASSSSRKKPRTSLFGQVKAKVEGRKTG